MTKILKLSELCPFFFQATATEDVAESLSPDDGEFTRLAPAKQKVDNVFRVTLLTLLLFLTLLGNLEDRMHSGGDILHDCSSEHSSLTKTESDPPGDLSLPGKKSSVGNKRKIPDCQEKFLKPLQTVKK